MRGLFACLAICMSVRTFPKFVSAKHFLNFPNTTISVYWSLIFFHMVEWFWKFRPFAQFVLFIEYNNSIHMSTYKLTPIKHRGLVVLSIQHSYRRLKYPKYRIPNHEKMCKVNWIISNIKQIELPPGVCTDLISYFITYLTILLP